MRLGEITTPHFYGGRRYAWLRSQGYGVIPTRPPAVRTMGRRRLCQAPSPGGRGPYDYTIGSGVRVARVNSVEYSYYYISLQSGFCIGGLLDWCSRYVLSWAVRLRWTSVCGRP